MNENRDNLANDRLVFEREDEDAGEIDPRDGRWVFDGREL